MEGYSCECGETRESCVAVEVFYCLRQLNLVRASAEFTTPHRPPTTHLSNTLVKLESFSPDSYPFDSHVLLLNVPMTMSSSLMDPGKTTSENDSLQHNFNQQGSRLDGCLMFNSSFSQKKI